MPHAMHIHGILGDANVCAPASADTSGDGLISLEEGAPFYGPIDTSFTTPGDTSAARSCASRCSSSDLMGKYIAAARLQEDGTHGSTPPEAHSSE